MRDNSNTIIYIVAGIIVLHFVVGIIWLVIKLCKKKGGPTRLMKYICAEFGFVTFTVTKLKGNPVKIWNCSRNCKHVLNFIQYLTFYTLVAIYFIPLIISGRLYSKLQVRRPA